MEGTYHHLKINASAISLSFTVPLSAPDALKIITENDHILLFWKSLALKESNFNESRVSHAQSLLVVWFDKDDLRTQHADRCVPVCMYIHVWDISRVSQYAVLHSKNTTKLSLGTVSQPGLAPLFLRDRLAGTTRNSS